MGTAHKGFEAQLGSYRFILSPGTVFMKISKPGCIKQSLSAFHFSISAISPKGNPEPAITAQKCRMGNLGPGSDRCPRRGSQTKEPWLWVTRQDPTSHPVQGRRSLPNSPSGTCTAEM